MFKGAITALITPFKNGVFDEKAFGDFVEWQVQQGIKGLVPCGTTGESPTLSHEEHNRVVSVCVEVAKGRVPVIAGAGSNATSEAIEMSRHAEKIGADAVLVATPYYNKPTADGLYHHYKAINDAVSIPIILYNIPGRSVVDMSDVLIAKLAQLENIKGIKDATGDVSRISSLQLLIDDKDFCYLSGEDGTAVAFNAQGGEGVISVTANVAPKLCAELQDACQSYDYKKALELHNNLMPIHMAMFCETSPGPVKYALSELGLCSEELRLPMVPPSSENKRYILDTLTKAKLISDAGTCLAQ